MSKNPGQASAAGHGQLKKPTRGTPGMPRSPQLLKPALTSIVRARPQRAAPNVRPSIGPEGAGRDVRLRLAAPQAPPREVAWRFGLEQLKPV